MSNKAGGARAIRESFDLGAMDEEDELERRIDLEIELDENLLSHVARKSRGTPNLRRNTSSEHLRQSNGVSSPRAPRTPTHARTPVVLGVRTAWSSQQEDGAPNGAMATLQRRIDELERKVAEAAVELTDAQRKAIKQRTARERNRFLRAERTSGEAEPLLFDVPPPSSVAFFDTLFFASELYARKEEVFEARREQQHQARTSANRPAHRHHTHQPAPGCSCVQGTGRDA